MPKPDQTALLTVQGSSFLGQAVVGIFFPFFVQRAFGLTDAQILWWFSGLSLLMATLVFPLSRWLINGYGVRRTMQLSMIFQMLFYLIIGLQLDSTLALAAASLALVGQVCLFWPGFHILTIKATQTGGRGNFFGTFQALAVGVNLVAPVVTGFLLDLGLERWSLLFAMACFLVATFYLQRIPKVGEHVEPWKAQWSSLKTVYAHPDHRAAFISEGIMSGTMWMLWPLYFKAVVGKFSLMGLITAFMAGLEIFTSKYFGRMTDKISAKKMMYYGAWARCIDLVSRAVYLKFSSLGVVIGMQFFAATLGPIFQTSYLARIFEVGEATTPHLLNYVITREISLGLIRMLWCALAALVITYWGTMALGWLFVIAGISALGFRRL